jgi:serine-type D-Ala-D-Ala carboxypeptidase/endopeptidase (penicillin-binding protein 4)
MRRRSFCALALVLSLAACEGSPTLPPHIPAAGGRSGLSPSPSLSPCVVLTRVRDRLARRPAPWKARIDRIVRGYSVGIAIGVNGVILYEHDARQRRTPASNEKLMLSMAVFDLLGPHFRIKTRAMARRVAHGTVKGDLWIVGGGDPSLTAKQPHFWGSLASPTLQHLAHRVRAKGIEDIRGKVRGATDLFAHDFDAPGWQPFVPRSYVELAAGLSLNGNFHVKGVPERAAARAITRQLSRSGIDVEEPAAAGEAPSGLEQIAQVRSAPLSDLVAYMDQSSNNFYAEMLGKLLGADTYGPPGTIRKGARAVAAWAGAHGVRIVAHDSSGLSYKDKVSPLGLVQLLAAAEGRPWGVRLRHDLPAPGQGTLAGRLSGLDVHAKTGTLFNSDSALSGWVRREKGSPWIEFSILDQGMPKAVEDKIIGVLARAPISLSAAAHRRPPGCS